LQPTQYQSILPQVDPLSSAVSPHASLPHFSIFYYKEVRIGNAYDGPCIHIHGPVCPRLVLGQALPIRKIGSLFPPSVPRIRFQVGYYLHLKDLHAAGLKMHSSTLLRIATLASPFFVQPALGDGGDDLADSIYQVP
jgi:hypothetical protein